MCEDTEKLSGDPVSGQEDAQDAGRHCAWLAPLILYLIPQIDKLYLHFGLKDPASTGKMLGMLSSFGFGFN